MVLENGIDHDSSREEIQEEPPEEGTPPMSDDEMLDDAERIATIEDVFNQTLNQWGSGTLIQAELSPRRPEFVLQ